MRRATEGLGPPRLQSTRSSDGDNAWPCLHSNIPEFDGSVEGATQKLVTTQPNHLDHFLFVTHAVEHRSGGADVQGGYNTRMSSHH